MPTRGKDFWKSNNSLPNLTSNAEYVDMLDQDKITDKHLRWEHLKYQIRKCTMNFLKNLVKGENEDRIILEKELKKLEKKNLTSFQTSEYYLECKQKL